MNAPVLLQNLPQLSDALASLVMQTAPVLCAVRVGPNRHVTGLMWSADLLITADQTLPAQDTYSVVLPSAGNIAPARIVRRDPATNLACLQLDSPIGAPSIQPATEPMVGHLVLVLAAELDASPAARLSMIRRVAVSGPFGTSHVLDLSSPGGDGGFVFDARGLLVGMLTPGLGGEALVVPCSAIQRLVEPLSIAAHSGPARVALLHGGRPWLGVALQPITLPESLRPAAGQSSGRMVVSVTPNGPAHGAGLRLGDILLAIDGVTLAGSYHMRGVLSAGRVGSPVEVRLLRDGVVRTCAVTVATHPRATGAA